jgi:hypothetical protein
MCLRNDSGKGGISESIFQLSNGVSAPGGEKQWVLEASNTDVMTAWLRAIRGNVKRLQCQEVVTQKAKADRRGSWDEELTDDQLRNAINGAADAALTPKFDPDTGTSFFTHKMLCLAAAPADTDVVVLLQHTTGEPL